MHYLHTEQYTYLAGEINALYHEAAVKMGISDSVQNILYVLCEKEGRCLQSEVSKLTGISRQTINSAIRKLEKEAIVYLHEMENKIWNEWTAEEQQQYLTLTKKYRDGLKKYLKDIL